MAGGSGRRLPKSKSSAFSNHSTASESRRVMEEERERMSKKKPESSFVEDSGSHWLDDKEGGDGGHGWRSGRGDVAAEKAMFPWSSMRSATANSRNEAVEISGIYSIPCKLLLFSITT
ncbi:hypothetical protein OIU74_005358 [Salix koriyanagi]|uniref:Uncharacterized protein n=1 Tax=Salix koriyanagi TaxID=2511006 RepID=A0A9Q0UPC0_9ROSI|nr:hypothetical protein OIU74_005358 [Salix koriyanagi]